MRILNLTPHPINVLRNGAVIEILPEPAPARVSSKFVSAGSVDGINLYRAVYGDVTGLPAEDEDTRLIVSAMVADACPGRYDLYSPASGHPEVVRNDKGQIVSVPGLVSNFGKVKK